MQKTLNKKGFTLVEVLLVVVIIAILAAIVIVAINPTRQIQQANNAQRRVDIKTILDAVVEYSVDSRGALPTGIPATENSETAAVIGSDTTNGQIDICATLVPLYVPALPYDPTATGAQYTSCTDYDTGYTIVSTNGRVTVAAPDAELSETITATK
ncbi:prepilin-type N-terminal cleavage/methylation domain-containing protein [Candidatus Peregrinibacteria bacterium]|nr:prepilin-type N-terminal cleavage/methylation domain-containing protein [Candidatus Peregrinibacteria bacterium]